jgi:hypothetical protein
MTEPTNLWDKADAEIEKLRALIAKQNALIARLRNQIEQERKEHLEGMRRLADAAAEIAREALL